MTILKSIENFAKTKPNTLAIIDTTINLTYREYWTKINKCACYLKDIGVKNGELVIVKNTQDVKYLVLIHALQLVCAIPVPLEKSVNEGRISEIADDTKSTKLFCDLNIDGFECYQILDDYKSSNSYEFPLPNPDDDAMVLFTTGTTGKSKGIVITYSAEYAVAENVKYGVLMEEDNVEIIPMPMNHSFSLRRYFANMINGSTAIIIDGVFFVKILFEMIEKYNATSIALAPAAMSVIFKLTRDKIAEYKDKLRYIQFGSAPLSESDKDHMVSIMPNVRFYNIYGSTELGCSTVLDFNSSDNMPNCIGYATKNSIFRVTDFNGNVITDATRENPGLLSYTGSMKMKCYYNAPELTKQTFTDGYMKSSDLGFIDEKGLIFMLGRADDVIITGGNKVSPLEVEEIANSVVGVTDSICKSREDSIVGAVPVLYITVDNSFDKLTLEKKLNDALEDFKRPKNITIIDAIPRTYNGKIDRKTNI